RLREQVQAKRGYADGKRRATAAVLQSGDLTALWRANWTLTAARRRDRPPSVELPRLSPVKRDQSTFVTGCNKSALIPAGQWLPPGLRARPPPSSRPVLTIPLVAPLSFVGAPPG